jgi:hypothetical protein
LGVFDVSRWHLLLDRQKPRERLNDSAQLLPEDELFERFCAGEGERLAPEKVKMRARP